MLKIVGGITRERKVRTGILPSAVRSIRGIQGFKQALKVIFISFGIWRIDKDTGMLEVVTDISQKLNKCQGINFLA